MRLDTFLYPSIFTKLPKRTAFNVILIDPPWQYRDRINDHSRGAINHYPTLSLDQIKAFPINDYSHAGTYLFLWTTKDFRINAEKIMFTWGFEFKTEFIWVKTKQNKDGKPVLDSDEDLVPVGDVRIGMGHYNRLCHEVMLLGVLPGANTPLKNATKEPSVFFASISEHSAKPAESYALIERNVDPPYLEIFARKNRPNWVSWGNEIETPILP